MNHHRIGAALACLTATALLTLAGEPRLMPELNPRLVTFGARELPLQDVLKALEKQTGNTIDDRRSERTNPTLKLPANPSTFWQTLDSLGLGYSAYQPDGGVALVDTPVRPLKTHYSGLFRFAVKRIAVSRDEETLAHHCQVTLDAAWEPRFQPLYLNLERAEVRFDKKSESLDRQTSRSVAGSSATEIELRMQAPPRTVLNLDSLKGELRVIGAPKMLEFKFDPLAAGKKTEQDGIKISVTDLKKSKLHWIVDILIENPPGAILRFEDTHQSWLDNNRAWLMWTVGTTKVVHKLEGELARQNGTETRMAVQLVFEAKDKLPLPPPNTAVTLHYRTPNRVVAFAVPFEFAALPLP